MRNYSHFLILIVCISLASCSKSESPGKVAAKPAIDTNQKAEAVQITEPNHHLYFRPKVGSVQHYHIVDRMLMSSSDLSPNGQSANHTGSSTTDLYIQQAVKAVNADSSVQLIYRVDSIVISSARDTAKVNYSSNNPKDKTNNDYIEYNMVVGKDFSIQSDKFGDQYEITDVKGITDALLATVPDSVKKRPDVPHLAEQQARQVANTYVIRVIVHNPTQALVKDTTWRDEGDENMDIVQGLSFPIHVVATETVHGLEKRGDNVVAVLEDNTNTTVKTKVLEQGPVKATMSDLLATSHSMIHIDDATGVLMQRTMQEKRNIVLAIESKEHPSDKRTITQNTSENIVTELVE